MSDDWVGRRDSIARGCNSTARGGAGRPTAAERVADVLRSGILSGELRGGTRLVQPRIARALEVSTTPVRDALQRLAVEGLVRFDEHRTAVVHGLSRSELVEIYELRKVLEPIAVVRTVKCADRSTLVNAVETVAAMQEVTDPGRFSELNSRFHSILEGGGEGSHLQDTLARLRALSALYVTHSLLLSPERITVGHLEHRRILEAVIDRDADAAASAVLRHLDGTLRALLGMRDRHLGPGLTCLGQPDGGAPPA